MSDTDFLGTLIVILLVIIIVWLLIRELVLWYFKINKRVELQEEQNRLLRKIIDKLPAYDEYEVNSSEAKAEPDSEVNINELILKVKTGEALIKHKSTGDAKIVTAEDYAIMENKDDFDIILEK